MKIAMMLVHEDANINHKGYNGMSPLAMAALHDHGKMVHYLLHKNAEVNLRNNADQTIKSNYGKTAEQYALESGHSSVVHVLKKIK